MARHTHPRVCFTPEVAEQILTRLSEGQSLSRICGPDRDPGMPDRITVHRHAREDRGFRLAYLLARQAQAVTLADEIIEIADGLSTQFGQTPNVSRDRLRVQARQWLAGVMAPRIFGKRATLQQEVEALEREFAQAQAQAEAEAEAAEAEAAEAEAAETAAAEAAAAQAVEAAQAAVAAAAAQVAQAAERTQAAAAAEGEAKLLAFRGVRREDAGGRTGRPWPLQRGGFAAAPAEGIGGVAGERGLGEACGGAEAAEDVRQGCGGGLRPGFEGRSSSAA